MQDYERENSNNNINDYNADNNRENNSYENNSYENNSYENNNYENNSYENNGFANNESMTDNSENSGYESNSSESNGYENNIAESYENNVHESNSYESNSYENNGHEGNSYENSYQPDYSLQQNNSCNSQPDYSSYGNYNDYNNGMNNSYNNDYNNNYNNGYYNSDFNSYQQQPVNNKAGKKTGRRILAGAVAAAVCFGFGFGGGALAINLMGKNTGITGSSNTTISMDANTVSTLNAASAIAEKVLPSVVSIVTTEKVTQSTYFGTQSGMASGLGTGLIVSSDGYILTNSHVVGDGQAITVTVSTYDGQEYDGKVLYYNTVLDLAIVKIEATGLTAAELGDSDTVNIGDYAVAIGNPMKMNYERSVSQGIISGLDRTVAATNSLTGTTNNMEGLIQTDAAINSGNSGGPLINSQGQVIGINTVKTGSADGMGFAIPINTAVPIVQEIIQNGTYEDAYIGIRGTSVEDILSEGYRLDANSETGVYIRQIYTQSPASQSGLREGDIITSIDGEEIKNMTQIKQFLAKHKPGDVVNVTVERDRQSQTFSVTLGKSDSFSNIVPNTESQSDGSGGNNGGSLFGDNGGYGGLFGGNGGNGYYYYGY